MNETNESTDLSGDQRAETSAPAAIETAFNENPIPSGELAENTAQRAPETEVEVEQAEQSGGRNLAVVTGASSGIGFEMAHQLAARGFDLLIAAEDDAIDQAAGELSSHGAEVQTCVVDLATYEGVERLSRRILELGRPVEALCVNAGVGVGGRFIETSLDEELKMIDLNVKGAVQLCKRVLPDMVRRNQGHIVVTSSVAGVMPSPFEAVYGATKAFLLIFSESLAGELRDTNVTVTAVMPGPTETNFFHRAHMDDTKAGQEKKDSAEDVARRAIDAMLDGKQKAYVGSFKNRVMGMMADLLPDEVGEGAHRKLSEPQSGSHASMR